ncbi:MAG: hypothetical protein ACYS22_19750 [Planctomycetota bacterium]
MPTPRSLLALAVLAGATCLPLTATAQGEDPRMASIQTLKEQAAEIRGLAWKRDVNVEWRSSSSLREYFEGAFDKEISPEEVTLAQATLRHLGMIPTDKDLKTLYLDMVEEGVAGFYDPSNETLWIIEQENALTGAAADANNDMRSRTSTTTSRRATRPTRVTTTALWASKGSSKARPPTR